jgi:hyaluronan synthase
VRVKSVRPLLWVVLADVAAVGIFRHVQFFALYRANQLLMALWGVIFMLTVIQWFISWRERAATVSLRAKAYLDTLVVAVNVPVYNEDRALLDRCLYALFSQTRLPDLVEVVDDGSAVDYSDVRSYWLSHCPRGSRLSWVRQENRGKKQAQARTFGSVRADILVTLDSDTALERRAIEEGLKPFADQSVQSVAGLELAYNHHRSWLTRISGTRSLIWQLLSCSAQSIFGDVLVNRGTFALYRAAVIQDNLDAYLYEMFFGNPVHLGDDAALTLFARGRGRAVQQPSAIQLAMYPETLSHLFRQWTRWMRGSTVRTFWRIRYLPLMSWSWWFTVISLWTFLASTGAVVAAAIDWSTARAYVVTTLIATAVCAYAQAVRIFSVVRSDESWFGRLISFLLAPIVSLWVMFVLRPLRFYGIATCMRQGWVTRTKKVEVGIGAAAEKAGPDVVIRGQEDKAR